MRLQSTFAALTLAAVAAAPLAAIAADDKARTYTREEIEEIVVETILEKPEVILQSVQKMQEKEQANQIEQSKQVIAAYQTSLFEDKDSPVAGAENPDVTVVEFFDYNCGYCKRSMDTVMQMLKTDKKVNFVFKEYPVLAESSETAARASLAMYYLEPKHYFDYHAALFRLGGKFDEANLIKVAVGFDVDGDKFKKMMDSERVENHLDETKTLAAKLGASGVPVFIIGGEMFPGAISYEAMKDQVDAVRAAAKKG